MLGLALRKTLDGLVDRNPFLLAALAVAGLLAALALGVVIRGTSTPAVGPPVEAADLHADPAGHPGTSVSSSSAPRAPHPVEPDGFVTTSSGLKFHDLRVGSGAEPNSGDVVQVHYTGWLTDGTPFDSSLERGAPISFPVGTGAVIPGWDEGIASMREGGRRQLVVPPDLAYGSRGFPPLIPGNATLVFEVELVDVP